MHQHACLATSRSCCHDDIFRLLIVDNLTLTVGEFTKELIVFCRSDILVNLCSTFFFEILVDELAEIQCKVVVHETQCRMIVAHHQVGIFTHDMNLADSLLIEFIQQAILFLTISCTCRNKTSYLHGMIKDDKTSFNLHQLSLG